jgi:fumarate hydratase subunit beta
MSNVYRLTTPLSSEAVLSLQAGDRVLLSGEVYTARDMAHKRLCQQIQEGQAPAFELKGAIIYFVGPTPARPGRIIGAAGPTTASRMDPFSPELMARGLKAMIGKGYRSHRVRDALQTYGAVHLSAVGGAGALLNKHILAMEVIAFEDLGTEAVRCLEVADFPVVVAYDAHGGSVYGANQEDIAL